MQYVKLVCEMQYVFLIDMFVCCTLINLCWIHPMSVAIILLVVQIKLEA